MRQQMSTDLAAAVREAAVPWASGYRAALGFGGAEMFDLREMFDLQEGEEATRRRPWRVERQGGVQGRKGARGCAGREGGGELGAGRGSGRPGARRAAGAEKGSHRRLRWRGSTREWSDGGARW